MPWFRWGSGGGGGGNAFRSTPSPTDTALLVPEAAENVEEARGEGSAAAAVAAEHLYVEIPPAPPSYDGDENGAAAQSHDDAAADPPSYQAATKLPTYDESERTKGECERQ